MADDRAHQCPGQNWRQATDKVRKRKRVENRSVKPVFVPIVGALTRSIVALYALHGALLMFLAGDVRQYLPVVRFLAVAGTVFGAVMLGIDCAVGMPLPWTVGEGPYVVALSAVIFWLTGRKRFTSTAAAA